MALSSLTPFKDKGKKGEREGERDERKKGDREGKLYFFNQERNQDLF